MMAKVALAIVLRVVWLTALIYLVASHDHSVFGYLCAAYLLLGGCAVLLLDDLKAHRSAGNLVTLLGALCAGALAYWAVLPRLLKIKASAAESKPLPGADSGERE